MGSYENLLNKANEVLGLHLNELGFYYDPIIEKFIGFTKYEILILELIERSRATRVELGFFRYFNLLDENYSFKIPDKERIYSKKTIGYPHWLYYPKDCKKKTKKILDEQLNMILIEMLRDIKLYLEPRISVPYPIDGYIKKYYIEDSDELTRTNHPDGYDFSYEWYKTKEETELENWTYILADDEYKYTSTKREELLPFEQYKADSLKKLERNKKIYQEEAKKYLSQYNDSQLIIPSFEYYTVEKFLESGTGKKLVLELEKLNLFKTDSISTVIKGDILFYNSDLKKEVYLSIDDGIYWSLRHSIIDAYGLPRVSIVGCVEEKYFSYGCNIYDVENSKKQIQMLIGKLKLEL